MLCTQCYQNEKDSGGGKLCYVRNEESDILNPHLSLCSIPNVTSRIKFANSSRSSGAIIANNLSVSVSRISPPYVSVHRFYHDRADEASQNPCREVNIMPPRQ